MIKSNQSLLLYTLLTLISGLFVRVLTLSEPDLIDSTEGRYATIAQDMVISQNWSEPQIRMFGEVESYLGKPPLHFWLVAGAIEVFGMNQWAVRLPSFLSAIITLCAIIAFAQKFFNLQIGLLSGCILISSGMFFFLSGACLLDTSLAACLSSALVGLSFCMIDNSRNLTLGGLIAALSVGLGFLIKGPVALVIVAGTILLWLILARDFSPLGNVPWIRSSIIFLVIVIPWFAYQEYYNPGFLQYFFINENFKRYLEVNYGDKYGAGHTSIYGISWGMLILAFLPWSFVLFGHLVSYFKRGEASYFTCSVQKKAALFCVAWGVFPALFFTFSKQLTATYMLSGLPGLALFCAWRIQAGESSGSSSYKLTRKILYALFVISSLTLIGFTLTGFIVKAPILPFSFGALVGVIGVAFALYLLINIKIHSLSWLTVSLSLLVISVYLSFILNLTHYISERRSTATILSHIKRDSTNRSSVVGILFGNPFSANFYSRSEPSRLLSVKWITQEDLLNDEVPNLILRSSDQVLLHDTIKKMYSIQESVGPWIWMRLIEKDR